MKEELVGFETAQLAKEKGFDAPGDIFYIISTRKYPTDKPVSSDTIMRLGLTIDVAAPTQSLLQRWLRDVHNIHIENSLSDLELHWDVALYEIRPEARWLKSGQRQIPSYEEAIEVGLIKALKLIKL